MSYIRIIKSDQPPAPIPNELIIWADLTNDRLSSIDENGTIRILDTLETSKFEQHASDAEFDAIYAPLQGGMCYFNTTTNNVRVYNGTIWEDLTATLAELQGQTGLISGGEVTQASATTVNIASGKGYIFDYSDPEHPEITFVTWDEILGYDIAVVTGSTLLGFGVAGTLTEVLVKTDEAMRTYILVAGVTLMGGNIAAVDDAPRNIGYNAPHSFRDFIHNIIGPANASGNEIAYRGADLTLYSPGGAVYNLGSNQRNDPTEPDILQVPEGDPLAFFYSVRIAPGAPFYAIGAPGIYVDPDNYDDGSGGPVSVPAGKFTVQQAYITPNGIHALCYGQKLFDTMEDAIDAVSANTLDFEENVPIRDFTRRTYIAMQQGSTVLNDEIYAQFIQDGQFRFTAPTSANLLANIYKWQFDVSAEATIDLHNIEFPKLGTPAYDDLSDFFPAQQSAGVIEGGEITDGGSGSIDIAGVSFLIKITDSEIGSNVFADLTGSNLATLVDERLNFVYVDYNAGTPIFVSTDLSADISFHDQILLGTVYRSGTTLTIDQVDKQRSVDTSKRLYDIETFANAWVQTGCYSNIDHVVKVGTDTIDIKPGSGWIRKTSGEIVYLSWAGETNLDVSYIGNEIPWVCYVLDPGETFLVREIIQFLPDQDIDSFEGIIVAGRVWYFEGALVVSGRHMLVSRDPSVARSAAWTNKAYNVSVGIIASTIDTNYFDIIEGWMFRWPVIEIGTGHHNFLTPGVVQMQTIWGHIIGQDYHDDIIDDAGGDEFDITQVANYWDNAGTIEIIPVGKFAVHEIRIYPQSSVRVWVRAQEHFSTLLDAQNSIARQSYELSPWLENMQQCPINAYVLLKRGCTDFTDDAQAYIQVNTGAGGGGGSGGASSASPWKTATGGIEYTGGSVAVAPITGNGTFDVWGENSTYNRLLVLSKADDAAISFTGTLGDLLIDRDHSGTNVMNIDGSTGALTLTNNGVTDFTMHSTTANNRFYMYADDTVGGRVLVNNAGEINIGSLDYASGELILWSGAAEQLVIGTTGSFNFSANTLSNISNLNTVSAIDTTTATTIANALDPNEVFMDTLGTPTYKSLEDWSDTTQSAGVLTSLALSDGGGGTVNVAPGTGILKTTDSDVGENVFFDFAGATGIAVTANEVSYIYIDYNGGTPIIGVTLLPSTVTGTTQFVIGLAYGDGITTGVTTASQDISNLANRIYVRDYEQFGFIRTSGMILQSKGTLSFAVSEGVWWAAFTRGISSAFDMTTGDTFTTFHSDGVGGWIRTPGQTAFDNINYDNGVGLVPGVEGRYLLHWIYYTLTDEIAVQYGRGSYSYGEVQTINPPQTSDIISKYSILIGKVAVLYNSTSYELSNVADSDTYFGAFDSARWSDNVNGIYYDIGNVGIGAIPDASARLIVVGDSILNGGVTIEDDTIASLHLKAGTEDLSIFEVDSTWGNVKIGDIAGVGTGGNMYMYYSGITGIKMSAVDGIEINYEKVDTDFTIHGSPGVTALKYNAGNDDFNVNGNWIFNVDFADRDFAIRSQFDWSAYAFNAGTSRHYFRGDVHLSKSTGEDGFFWDDSTNMSTWFRNFRIKKADDTTNAYYYESGIDTHYFDGTAIFNGVLGDIDFTINGTGGAAYKFDAGNNRHTFDGDIYLGDNTNLIQMTTQGQVLEIKGKGNGTGSGVTISNRDSGNSLTKIVVSGNHELQFLAGAEASPQKMAYFKYDPAGVMRIAFNPDGNDQDFQIAKSGGGSALFYDAGDDEFEFYSDTKFTDSIVHVGTTESGTATIDELTTALLITAQEFNTAARYTPAIKFGSTDTQFTTTNPKFLAGIAGKSGEQYGIDTDGGMGLSFFTSPNHPGAAPTPVERIQIDQAGVFRTLFSASFNSDFLDADFNINRETEFPALNYDAGNDQWKQNGTIFFNYNHLDKDFYIYAQSGTAYNYNAGAASHSWNGTAEFNVLDDVDVDFIINGVSGEALKYDSGTNEFVFTSTDVLLRGTSQLGVGAATANYLLHVQKSLGACEVMFATTLDNPVSLIFETDAGDKTGEVLSRQITGDVYVGDVDSNSGKLMLYSDGAVAATFDENQDVTFAGNIDGNQTFSGNQTIQGQAIFPWHTITYASSISPNWDNGNNQRCIITGNVTVANPSNATDGARYIINLQMDGSGGHTVNWGTQYRFPNGSPPSVDTSANHITIAEFIYWNGLMLAVSTITGLDIT